MLLGKTCSWMFMLSIIFSATGNSSMSINMTTAAPHSKQNQSYTSPWLASEASKHRLEVTDMLPGNTMPVNSIDIDGNVLLCGTDSEQMYVVKNMTIR